MSRICRAKYRIILLAIILASALLIGCEKKDEIPFTQSLTYSNLADEASQAEVRAALEYAKVPKERIDFFFENVNRFNEAVGKELLSDGFVTIEGLLPEYDTVKMQERWEEKYPQSSGMNCRLTVYTLMQDLVQIEQPRDLVSDEYELDWWEIVENEENFKEDSIHFYKPFFSAVASEGNRRDYPEAIRKSMRERQMDFPSDKASVISVYFEVPEGEGGASGYYVFVGHTGVLIEREDGSLLFIEKIAFQEPYQAIKFENRTQLNDYLMNRYDVEYGQKTVRPFIMENNHLLEGYRANPNNPNGGKVVKDS